MPYTLLHYVVKKYLPERLRRFPMPRNVEEFHLLTWEEWLQIFAALSALYGVVVYKLMTEPPHHISDYVGRNSRFDEKSLDIFLTKDIRDGTTFCRCLKSKQFPYCDGTHNAFNKDKHTDILPLIVTRSAYPLTQLPARDFPVENRCSILKNSMSCTTSKTLDSKRQLSSILRKPTVNPPTTTAQIPTTQMRDDLTLSTPMLLNLQDSDVSLLELDPQDSWSCTTSKKLDSKRQLSSILRKPTVNPPPPPTTQIPTTQMRDDLTLSTPVLLNLQDSDVALLELDPQDSWDASSSTSLLLDGEDYDEGDFQLDDEEEDFQLEELATRLEELRTVVGGLTSNIVGVEAKLVDSLNKFDRKYFIEGASHVPMPHLISNAGNNYASRKVSDIEVGDRLRDDDDDDDTSSDIFGYHHKFSSSSSQLEADQYHLNNDWNVSSSTTSSSRKENEDIDLTEFTARLAELRSVTGGLASNIGGIETKLVDSFTKFAQRSIPKTEKTSRGPINKQRYNKITPTPYPIKPMIKSLDDYYEIDSSNCAMMIKPIKSEPLKHYCTSQVGPPQQRRPTRNVVDFHELQEHVLAMERKLPLQDIHDFSTTIQPRTDDVRNFSAQRNGKGNFKEFQEDLIAAESRLQNAWSEMNTKGVNTRPIKSDPLKIQTPDVCSNPHAQQRRRKRDFVELQEDLLEAESRLQDAWGRVEAETRSQNLLDNIETDNRSGISTMVEPIKCNTLKSRTPDLCRNPHAQQRRSQRDFIELQGDLLEAENRLHDALGEMKITGGWTTADDRNVPAQLYGRRKRDSVDFHDLQENVLVMEKRLQSIHDYSDAADSRISTMIKPIKSKNSTNSTTSVRNVPAWHELREDLRTAESRLQDALGRVGTKGRSQNVLDEIFSDDDDVDF